MNALNIRGRLLDLVTGSHKIRHLLLLLTLVKSSEITLLVYFLPYFLSPLTDRP